ncbi:MAG: uroporphyrinogen-III synthase [Kofleriaceae bacterium]
MPYAVATRDAARAAPFLAALAPLGLTGVAMPVTSTAAAADASRLEASLRSLGAGDFVALASARASAAVGAAAAGLGRELREVGWWAVGDASAQPLRDLGYVVHTAARASADGLADALLAAGAAGRRVLVPRALDGRQDAVVALRGAGARVEELVVYRTVARAADAPELAEGLARWRAGEVAVAALFAPSQVTALGALLAAAGVTLAAPPVVFAAVGDTTARALRDLGLHEVAVARAPTPEAMANAVASRYPPRR